MAVVAAVVADAHGVAFRLMAMKDVKLVGCGVLGGSRVLLRDQGNAWKAGD